MAGATPDCSVYARVKGNATLDPKMFSAVDQADVNLGGDQLREVVVETLKDRVIIEPTSTGIRVSANGQELFYS